MSTLNFFFNCIIVAAGLRGISAGPAADAKPLIDETEQIEILRTEVLPIPTHCPCKKQLRDEESDWSNMNNSMNNGGGFSRNVIVHGMVCACNVGALGVTERDDYQYTAGIGSHKLHTRSEVWNVARKICNDEGGHLAIINSIAEAHILTDLFNRAGPIKNAGYPGEAFVGIHDLYKEGDWVTVLGDSLAKTGYTNWSLRWGGQPDNGGGLQNCGVFVKEGGLDDVNCEVAFPFFCEIPLIKVM